MKPKSHVQVERSLLICVLALLALSLTLTAAGVSLYLTGAIPINVNPFIFLIVALGLIFASAVYLRDHRTLLILCLAGLALSLADFAIAFSSANKSVRSEHGAHIGGAIGFAVLVILLAQAARP